MTTLGGSMFIRQAVEFDYCVAPALDSLCAACDDVVILDCQSTDGTLDVLRQCAARNANLRIVEGGPWEIAPDFNRLRILADLARGHLKTDYHLMLQADEVIHERSLSFIKAVVADARWKAFLCRRFNLYGDLNHYVRFDLEQGRKPCSDQVVRLALTRFPAHGDAESLAVPAGTSTASYLDSLVIYHYGLVRRDANHLDKIVSMQSWFFGNPAVVDKRVLEMKATSGRFEWERMYSARDLHKLPYPHPVFSAEWAAERQAEKAAIA
ncbi:MAG: hypothetical protein ACREQ5_08725 [Candidatus Dormibacteria bacterium]